MAIDDNVSGEEGSEEGVSEEGGVVLPNGMKAIKIAIAGSSLAGLRKISQDSGRSIQDVVASIIGLGVHLNYMRGKGARLGYLLPVDGKADQFEIHWTTYYKNLYGEPGKE